jgi:hypothetical protein
LNRLTGKNLPEDLSGKALFIDEAHHASADGLSQVVTLWRERGGQLFFFTPTPYHGDGRPVRLEGMRAFRRSLAEHMAEGFAPRHLESEMVTLGKPGDTTTAGQLNGEEAPPSSYFEGLVAAIGRRWLEEWQTEGDCAGTADTPASQHRLPDHGARHLLPLRPDPPGLAIRYAGASR